MIKKVAAFLVVFCFSLEQCFAQVAVPLNLSSAASFSLSADKYRPVHLRSLIFDRSANGFDLLLDRGDAQKTGLAGIRSDAEKLMEYFLVGISLPDSMFWVNLRPDGIKDIIDPLLEQTDLGRVLLEADVALKKDLAKATSPETVEGRKYWNRLYAKAESMFGKGEIKIPTIARPWIVPGEIIVRQSQDSVYVYKAALKVQLEQDYLKDSAAYNFDDARLKALNEYSSSLIRELILPVLNKRVNSSKTYAQLRQVYYSLILAQWFKKHFRGSSAEYAERIDSRDLRGLSSRTPWSKESCFEAYRKSFTDGEYNAQEKVAGLNGMSVRKYVSGGILPMPSLADNAQDLTSIRPDGGDIVVPAGVERLDSRTLSPVVEANNDNLLADGGKADQVFNTAGEFMAKIDYVMRMLGIKDYPRIAETFKRSLDPVAFVKNLDRISGLRLKDILSALDRSEFFKSVAANYRVRQADAFDPAEYSSPRMSVSVQAGGYAAEGIQQDVTGQPISDYLRLMRADSASVPFVFRDDMERFVGKFLGMSGVDASSPDLSGIVSEMERFLSTVDLNGIRYVVTSGIGANEMYSHQLAQAFNEYFKSQGIDMQWIVVNNPAHLNKIPASAVNENTIVFEMSRSGTTKETVDFFNATRDRFKTRIIAANSGPMRDAAYALKSQGGNVMIISNTPGDIGGRQMNRKTLMVYSPLFMALAAGTKDIGKAKELLRQYVAASFAANRELAYGNGLSSTAVGLAEFLFRHRASGKNKFSVVYDDTLRASAKELFQLLNEGANKNIAGGSNNNILDSYSLQADRARYETVFGKAAQSQLPIFLLNSSAPGYAEALAYVDGLNAKGIPAIAVTVEMGVDIARNLEVLARTSDLLQDMVVYFTYITSQDANSNPAVKMVREITAAMFEILQDKKQSGKGSINISFDDVMRKMGQKQAADQQKSVKTMDEKGVTLAAESKEFESFARAIKDLSNRLEVPETELTRVFMSAVSLAVAKADVGEAGGSKVADIEEAFARSAMSSLLGTMTPDRALVPLDVQQVLVENSDMKASIAISKDARIGARGALSEQLAEYFYAMYQQRKNDLQYLALTYMEADANNPLIGEIARTMTDKFADLNITTPLLALPGVAHTGIEAIMSHPENVFNIAIVYTDTYGSGLGKQAIGDGVTVDDATYVYGISNVIRMALAGTPNIIFEVKDSSQLGQIKGVIADALTLFRNRIGQPGRGEGASANQPGRDGGSKKDDQAAKDVGGIAFQALPMNDLTAIPALSAAAAGPVLSAVQLDKQWREIRLDMVKGGVPCLKMKEYIASARRERARMKAVATCVADILKAEEEAGAATSASLKEVLALLG